MLTFDRQVVTYEVHPVRGFEAKVEYEGTAQVELKNAERYLTNICCSTLTAPTLCLPHTGLLSR